MNIKATLLAMGVVGSLLAATMVQAQEPLQAITLPQDINAAEAELGKQLFFDPRLSKSGFISCNSCHNLSMGGTDNLPTSIGHGWSEGPINSPTVLNSAYNVAQFWDGRAADLQEQAGGPIANPGEMASSHSLAIEVLDSIPAYRAAFTYAFGSPGIDLERVTAALVEFERTLVTPNSRFDQWLNGNSSALSTQELEGYNQFKNVGCVGCHNGPAVGASSFMRMGITGAYNTTNPANGRIAVTGNPADNNVFKVPTLRNVALTYPYFHDGAVKTLPEAVTLIATLQLGRDLTDAQVADITAFLQTLTGDQPNFSLPQLPPSSAETPSPQPFN